MHITVHASVEMYSACSEEMAAVNFAVMSFHSAKTTCLQTRACIERLQCHPGKSGGHVFWCLQVCNRMFLICNRLFTTCNRTRDTKKHGRRSSRDDTATSLYKINNLHGTFQSGIFDSCGPLAIRICYQNH